MIGPTLDVLAKITAQYEQGVDQQKSRTAELQKIRQSLETETVRPHCKENKKAFNDVLQFELGFPVELCKAGITLLDSPGRDDDLDRNMMVDEAIGSCDAAVVVYRSDVFGGMSELNDVMEMEG